MVVRGKARVTLGEVADVDEQLRGLLGHADPLEQGRGPGALLVHRDGSPGTAVRIAHRIGASFCDPGQEGTRSHRPLDAAVEGEAISGDSAQSV